MSFLYNSLLSHQHNPIVRTPAKKLPISIISQLFLASSTTHHIWYANTLLSATAKQEDAAATLFSKTTALDYCFFSQANRWPRR